MALAKVTFTLDEPTLERLADAAERLKKPKSQVVREAIEDYHLRIGKMSEAERLYKLKLFDEAMALVPPRPRAEVEKELRELRRSRRQGVSSGWRRGY